MGDERSSIGNCFNWEAGRRATGVQAKACCLVLTGGAGVAAAGVTDVASTGGAGRRRGFGFGLGVAGAGAGVAMTTGFGGTAVVRGCW